MKYRLILASLIGLCSSIRPILAETRVFFDRDEYIVSAAGETFDVQILIDANDQTPEWEPLRQGLFSFGTQVTFDPTKAELSDPTAIGVASELDYFGFIDGAYTEVASGSAAGKGNIDQLANPLEPYRGPLLINLTLRNKATAVDAYPLQLAFFRTLGTNEQLFLDGSGAVLDNDIIFGDAVVRVVPEATSMSLCMVGSVLLLLARHRRRAGDAWP